MSVLSDVGAERCRTAGRKFTAIAFENFRQARDSYFAISRR